MQFIGGTDRAQILCETSHDSKEVYEWSKFQKLAANKILFSLNFENSRNLFIKSVNFFNLFYNVYKEKMLKLKMDTKRPKSLVFYILLSFLLLSSECGAFNYSVSIIKPLLRFLVFLSASLIKTLYVQTIKRIIKEAVYRLVLF